MKKILNILMLLVIFVCSSPITASAASKKEVSFPVAGMVFLKEEIVSGTVLTGNTPVYLVPVTHDYFYDYRFLEGNKVSPEKVWGYQVSNVEFEYQNLLYFQDVSMVYRYATIPKTTGHRYLAFLLLDKGTVKNGVYTPTEKYYIKISKTGISHSLVGDYYPNKIINDLEAAKAFVKYQIDNGPFYSGKEYSALKILSLKSGKYLMGTTSSNEVVPGGGVCAFVSNLAKALVGTGSTYVERWQVHPA